MKRLEVKRLMRRAPDKGRGPLRRGSSLIEVLLALAILGIMMVGILQMFTLSMFVNAGASARTTMIQRAQQVVENIRVAAFTARLGNNTMATALLDPASFSGTAGTFVLVQGSYELPYNSSSTNWAQFAAWGPDGANVVEQADAEFRIQYRIDVVNPAPGFPASTGRIAYLIRVTCIPEPIGGTGRRFFGTFQSKRIDYAAQIIL